MTTAISTAGLRVDGLTVDYGNGSGLWDFDLSVEPGEVVCVIGKNGAGKSSALLGISGFVAPQSGTVAVDGDAPTGTPYRRCKEHISLVVKGRSLFGSLTLADNLALAHIDEGEFFDLFPQLEPRRNVLAGSLSGGQQQLAAVGRALLRDVRVVLLDELTFGLSPAVRTLIARVVGEQAKRRNISVVVVEQHVETAVAIADRTLVLADGRTVLELDRDELVSATDHVEQTYLHP
ncbi:ABC transporter ATP-binding protein [Rhodococcus sp. 06-156-3C]|uniref:ABC transporter ATP-binding protein n=1 Tax=Nocardiaceae TaxID=85025 RepID=UPI000522F6B1|nr:MULTISPECIES: ATP-binding cassette domain-containing protein [Rhodococcus]OZD11084.1 ABC transporter ATP-binding protein [Rhodococcus sp. 06-156-4C]OZD14500.1 ABC transporter ATP-binding protein [Rhodococcus sp. 06-156-4a]OZD24834.1 ABC transporter ATP-binding protein [Rhodococcus sp. 06-156-3C]OZD27808.1 ABC transporter ATP-binding protein [Rhodococcus sp. 06-156-3b]OZD39789.1 ABC transporter ATP-binding protein [Rhodococcus sp. 06-156-3]